MKRPSALFFAWLLVASLRPAFGQDQALKDLRDRLARAKTQGAQAADDAKQQAALEKPARLKVTDILSRGGAVAAEDKPVLDKWFVYFLRKGEIGRPPDEQERRLLQRIFPKLAQKADWRVTGPCATNTNCIAWSVGDDKDWLWPGDSVKDFDVFYKQHGLVPLKPGEPPEKADVALWAKDGAPTHACRHLTGDWWESKLGRLCRIVHRLHDLEDSSYGAPIKYYRKGTPEELK